MSTASNLEVFPRTPLLLSANLFSQSSRKPSPLGELSRCCKRTWLLLNRHGRIKTVNARRKNVAAMLCGYRRKCDYLKEGFGWGVRRMVEATDEIRNVADVQAEAFHVPVSLFNDIFFEFFRAEVLSALVYRIRTSPPDRYTCLVAESTTVLDSLKEHMEGLVGVVDCTVQNEDDVLRHIQGENEYLYVSGLAVRKIFRRKKVATVLLKACDALSCQWGQDYIALRAYEDDSAAMQLYSKLGYKVVSRDPWWITWIGRKPRLLMIKTSSSL